MTHWIPPSLSHRLYILRMIIIRTEPHLLNQTDSQPATQRNQTKSWTRHRASIHSRELKSQSPRHSSSSSYPFHWWPFSARHHAQLITHIELSFKRICTYVGTHHRGHWMWVTLMEYLIVCVSICQPRWSWKNKSQRVKMIRSEKMTIPRDVVIYCTIMRPLNPQPRSSSTRVDLSMKLVCLGMCIYTIP